MMIAPLITIKAIFGCELPYATSSVVFVSIFFGCPFAKWIVTFPWKFEALNCFMTSSTVFIANPWYTSELIYNTVDTISHFIYVGQ